MSVKLGLSASEDDIDTQGEIDFDFFDESDEAGSKVKKNGDVSNEKKSHSDEDAGNGTNFSVDKNNFVPPNGYKVNGVFNKDDLSDLTGNDLQFKNHLSSNDYPSKPIITFSCSEENGSHVQKTVIEAVIPTLHEEAQPLRKSEERRSRKDKFRQAVEIDDICELEENEAGVSQSSNINNNADSDGTSSLSDDSLDCLSESGSFTSVSPLPSPYCRESPLPRNGEVKTPRSVSVKESAEKDAQNINLSEAETNSLETPPKKKENVKFSDDVQWDSTRENDSIDLNLLLKAIKQLESQENNKVARERKSASASHLSRGRKNMSFTNQEVRQIDHENQQLLKKIVTQQKRQKPKHNTNHRTVVPSSAVNRQRQQRQIEMENLALLKRLEATKPSRDISRTYLLRDFDRLSKFPSSSNASSRPTSANRLSPHISSSRNSARSSRTIVGGSHSATKLGSAGGRPKSSRKEPFARSTAWEW